jgi:hypothetical protein
MHRLKLVGLLTFVAILLMLGGLRVYGAFHSEKEGALTRATEADNQAALFQAESERLEQQHNCNLRWMDYENARLSKRIAELQGRIGRTPIEPMCTGYAMRLDSSLDLLTRQFNASLAAGAAGTTARRERLYAASRKLQTRYLETRVWAALTGTKPSKTQVQLVAEIDHQKCVDSLQGKDTKNLSQDDICGKATQ